MASALPFVTKIRKEVGTGIIYFHVHKRLVLECGGQFTIYWGNHQALPHVHGEETDQAAGVGQQVVQEQSGSRQVGREDNGNKTD